MRTPGDYRFMSDCWLHAATNYYYMEGDDSVGAELLWRACACGEFANIIEAEDGE